MELLSRLSHAFDSSTADQHDFEDGAGTGGKKQKNKKEYSIQAHLEKAHAKTDPNKFACLFIACFLFPTVIGSICTTCDRSLSANAKFAWALAAETLCCIPAGTCTGTGSCIHWRGR